MGERKSCEDVPWSSQRAWSAMLHVRPVSWHSLHCVWCKEAKRRGKVRKRSSLKALDVLYSMFCTLYYTILTDPNGVRTNRGNSGFILEEQKGADSIVFIIFERRKSRMCESLHVLCAIFCSIGNG